MRWVEKEAARQTAALRAQDAWDVAYGAIEREVVAAVKASGQRLRVQYSAYKSRNDIPINNLHRVAVRGRVVLVRERTTFYGGARSKHYRSPVVENPTWLQVAVLANAMIRVTRDRHHCFLEGLQRVDAGYAGIHVVGATMYRLLMGS